MHDAFCVHRLIINASVETTLLTQTRLSISCRLGEQNSSTWPQSSGCIVEIVSDDFNLQAYVSLKLVCFEEHELGSMFTLCLIILNYSIIQNISHISGTA